MKLTPTRTAGIRHGKAGGKILNILLPQLSHTKTAPITAWFCVGVFTALHVGLGVTSPVDLGPLFLDVPETLRATAGSAEAHAQRSRVVQLNPRVLQPGLGTLQQPGTRLTANLFEDQKYIMVVDRVEVKGPGEFVCFGRIEGAPDSYVILAAVDEAVAGTITLPGRAPFQVQYLGDGLHRVNEVLPPPPRWCGSGPRVALPGSPAENGQGAEAPSNGTGEAQEWKADRSPLRPAGDGGETNPPPVMIDFLVLYTPKALAGAGGEAGINALMDFAIAEANFCYSNSLVNVRWNIAYRGLVNYNESGDVCTDAGWLESNVSSLRSAYRADLAMMIVEYDNGGWSGCAWTWTTAFVRSRISSGLHLAVHEIGHLLGAGHDWLTCQSQPGNCGARYAYSYGHRFLAEGVTYGTVMAYEPGIGIPYFSNPNVLFHGVPTGVPAGQTNAADNARTINLYAPNVANLMRATNRFEFAASRYVASETAASVVLEVLRSGDAGATGTVECVTASGTATAGTDFLAATNLVTFASGEVRQRVAVTLQDDDLAEGDETFEVSLRKPQTGTALGLQSTMTVVIQDDEVNFCFATDQMTVPEGAGLIEVPVLRRGNTNLLVSLGYAVTEETAQGGNDLLAHPGALTFLPGETENVLHVEILDDLLAEPDETFTLSLQQPSQGAVVLPGSLTVTIADDERPGSVDPQFNASSSFNGWVYGLTAYPDGRVLCGGRFGAVNGQARTALVRLRPDGSVDPSFAPLDLSLSVTPDPALDPAHVSTVVVQPDDRLLILGQFASVNGGLRTHLARLNPDGSLDPSFVLSPGLDGTAYGGVGVEAHSLVLQHDGRILVGGAFHSVNGVPRYLLARLHSDGSVDQTFEAKPNKDSMNVRALALQPDGKILVGGSLTGFEGLARANVARLNADGQLDRTFRGSANGVVTKLHVLADGRILMGGSFTRNLLRLKPDGALDTSFTARPALNGHVWDFDVLADGRIVIVGAFTSTAGTNRNGIARLNPDGTLDPTFDAGLGANDIVRTVAIQPDGWVIVGGYFTAINRQPCRHLARLRSDGTRPTFAAPTLLANGELGMRLFGNAESTYAVESSRDLVTWAPVWTNTFSGTSWEWVEPGAPASGLRFYRAHQVRP